MNIDDTSLVRELTESFSSQVNTYCELKALVQKMMGKLILSRGDFTGLMGSMEQKKRLLDSIEHERLLHNNAIIQWQQRKRSIESSPEVNALDEILAHTGSVIKEFIDEEDQLQSYLERFITKSAT